jgi:hypothetical protein
MRRIVYWFFGFTCLAAMPAVGVAQVAGEASDSALPALRREVFGPRANVPVPAIPPVELPAKTIVDPVAPAPVVAERVVRTPAAIVTERPVVAQEVVAPAAVVTWWEAFVRNSYGFYDDGYLDDNWYYDYYDVPRPAARAVTVVQRPGSNAPVQGHHTSWVYEPVAERGLFSW